MRLTNDLGSTLSSTQLSLGKQILATLQKHYPAYAIGWDVSIADSVVYVKNTLLSGRWGFILHTQKIDPEGKAIVRAGGELLERYRQSRSRVLTFDQAMSGVREQAFDFRGEMVAQR